jgi:hypothetical protein
MQKSRAQSRPHRGNDNGRNNNVRLSDVPPLGYLGKDDYRRYNGRKSVASLRERPIIMILA